MTTLAEDFKERPVLTILLLVWVANFSVMWLISATRSRWATHTPDSIHTYPIRYKGSVTYYFHPVLGAYLEVGFWVMIGGLAVLFVVEWLRQKSKKKRSDA